MRPPTKKPITPTLKLRWPLTVDGICIQFRTLNEAQEAEKKYQQSPIPAQKTLVDKTLFLWNPGRTLPMQSVRWQFPNALVIQEVDVGVMAHEAVWAVVQDQLRSVGLRGGKYEVDEEEKEGSCIVEFGRRRLMK